MKEVKEKEKKESKEEVKSLALVPIKKIDPLALKTKENKILKILGKILLKIFVMLIKITIIIAIYATIFWIALYFSNKAMVDKLRQTEKNEIEGPVLTVIRENKTVDK